MAAERRRHSRATCAHCYRVGLLGRDFQAWRGAWEIRLEEAANGYATEQAEFRRENPPPTFKQYLIDNTGAGWPMSGRQPRRRHFAY